MYRFTPPTTPYRVGCPGTFWGRVKNDRGLAVVIYDDGRVATTTVAPAMSDDGVNTVYAGGRTYEIADSAASVLIAAGYSAYLQAVTP